MATPLRKCFVSRFGPKGVILSIDYSQLEIYVLAHLSGDKQLMADLELGIDLHGLRAAELFGPNYTEEQRTIAKSLSFQLQYGAGYKSMAVENNVSEDISKKFIENFYNRYPDVKVWQDGMINCVKRIRIPDNKRQTPKGFTPGVAKWESETGRIYTFVEKDAPEWMSNPARSRRAVMKNPVHTSFSPTEIKNWPVQGLATGDIVPIILGRIHRFIATLAGYRKSFYFVNTVHDSVIFDCKSVYVARDLAAKLKPIMEYAPQILKDRYGIDFDLPLKVEAKYGPSWAECNEKIDI